MVSRVPSSWLAKNTSDERNAAFDHALCLFIEIKSVSSDTGVYCGFIEEGFDHMEKLLPLVSL